MSEPVDPGHTPDEEYVPADDAVIGRAFRWSLVVIAALAVLVGVLWWVLTREAAPVETAIERGAIAAPARLPVGAADMPAVRYTDVTEAAGITFRHTSGAEGGKLLPETMGGGTAFVDYDDDGWQDLLLVNGTYWPESGKTDRPTMVLYRNLGNGRFEDVTRATGLDISFYGMGAAAADYDGDGDTDFFITALGPNHLLRNDGGRFRDVSERAGVAGGDDAWSSSAGFVDFDNDGDLDLFVCNYIAWSRELDVQLNFTLNGVDRAYGPPKQYPGTHSYLYRNDGDGTFTDVSAEAGIEVNNPVTGAPAGKALAATFADLDRDGLLEILVANDTVQNFLFHNRGDGTFEEIGTVSGIGYNSSGAATGAMGIDVGDFGNDGALGVGIGNFSNEATSFYVQQRNPLQFADMSNAEGIGSPSRLALSFGLFFFDYDLDSRLDILQTNGHLEEEINSVQPSQHYRQPSQLFWNCGPGARSCYRVVPHELAGDLSRPIVGRGAAYADIDGDGDLDVILTQIGDRPLLLRNEQELGHHWLRVRLRGSGANRDAIGAAVEIEADGVTQRRLVMPTRSYLSQVELPVTFGLGDATRVEALRVVWPDGTREEVTLDGIDREIVIDRSS